jgi:uncharacterized FAD-dependent dehydrogenase
LGQVFPGFLTQILREGFTEFGKSMRGYLTNEVLHAPESRTFPVRIPRDPITYEHLQIKGLYPCGEGQVMPAESLRPLMVRNALL